MLRNLKDLERFTVGAIDGDVGHVVDFLIDDERWIVRYLIVSTGGLFDGRHVLIAPVSFPDVEWSTQHFHVSLTMKKIKDSPSIDADKPVSRQHERDYHGYYGYRCYWEYSGTWGSDTCPSYALAGIGLESPFADTEEHGDIHLRSAREVRGYHIQGNNDAIGHIEDFIVDDQTWEVRYLAISTSNWWLGKKVLVAPQWANHVTWEAKKVHVDLSRQAIKDSPEWKPTLAINRE